MISLDISSSPNKQWYIFVSSFFFVLFLFDVESIYGARLWCGRPSWSESFLTCGERGGKFRVWGTAMRYRQSISCASIRSSSLKPNPFRTDDSFIPLRSLLLLSLQVWRGFHGIDLFRYIFEKFQGKRGVWNGEYPCNSCFVTCVNFGSIVLKDKKRRKERI